MASSIAATLALSCTLLSALPQVDANPHNSKTLNWASCDQASTEAAEFPIDCANITVPLEYGNPKSEPLELQLLRVKATKEPVKGSVLWNPGGPGDSGLGNILLLGGRALGGHFNFISFDPRGTGSTIPFVCDTGNDTESTGELSTRDTGNNTVVGQDPWKLLSSRAWRDGGAYVDSCAPAINKVGRYLGTAAVARDMLRIVEALGEDGKLRFWGTSYGTILGQTFAAMFPDRVDRLLFDSTMPTEDYYVGHWGSALEGADDSLSNYFSECITAGPTVCPLANYSGPSTKPQDLTSALNEAFAELIKNPVLLPDSFPPLLPWWQPGGVTLYSQLKYRAFTFLYNAGKFGKLNNIVSLTLARNWTGLTELIADVPADELKAPSQYAFHGIACAESALRAKSLDELYSVIQYQAGKSNWADTFGPQVWPCAQWPVKAVEIFEGAIRNVTTKVPALFVNGAYDPITPLRGAWEASASFPMSRVLIHKGHGHGVMNHPSNCTIKAITEYFEEGKLPKNGVECEPDQTAFELYKALVGA
ncbi:hypothetical protein NM208_g435 [Fusarium decemcellulare]|uniref:Uncharacterized protein n=1 Tax=Fusarium decemcellulare TaxID=57161 RepID=A0ACC1SZR4_9HYPO|nr:hypothetical protein NM208_g435 [Fusarium decemcellulare]